LHFCKTFCNINAVILLHSIQSVKRIERLHIMTKISTPTFGRGVVHPDSATPEQFARWQELGGVGHHPATRQAMERAIDYLLAEKAREVEPAIAHAISGPENNPNDRGECLDLNPQTLVRCDGRRVASREYFEGQGTIVRWTCNKCGWSKVV
jgi:hypothetical protein